jgi:hypothetical protein
MNKRADVTVTKLRKFYIRKLMQKKNHAISLVCGSAVIHVKELIDRTLDAL